MRQDTTGSFTLEASMLLPWVLMMTFLLLFFALYIAQGTLLYYSSSIMTERAAFNWSNSFKKVSTGAYPQGQYDGLYWRLTDDRLVQGLFGLATGGGETSVEVYPDMQGSEGSSAASKLVRVASATAGSHRVGSGEISYRNIGIKREIRAGLASVWLAEPLVRLRGGGAAEAEVSALVVEPAEFLRTFDLIRYYAAKMSRYSEGAEKYRAEAADVLSKRKM
ncbi:pilus assembly protein [Cohnella terricola]|uniref:Pilus assembly protein n=1 Tax=Cohnella terricola TaxID=1289167 RepID=A0A559JEA9_9BACL|nr:pilus assembly protein [Cohnella terricola]TVX98221.1 pilus assembly protein [Cohnella terricola]